MSSPQLPMESPASEPATVQRVVVLIPTYNERDTLLPIVERLRASVPAADVLIIDDGSPDGTGALADDLARGDRQVRVLHRTQKRGLGAAYLEGFAWALAQGYDALVEMDADGSHRPEQLPELLAALRSADVVLGSRWVRGGKVVNWPVQRKVLSVGGNIYTRIMLGIPVHDATGGYRAYRSSALRRMGLQGISSQGYCFQVELVWRALRHGLTVVEVPITFVEREVGYSKMSTDIVRESLISVTRWGIAHRAGQLRGASKREPRWQTL